MTYCLAAPKIIQAARTAKTGEFRSVPLPPGRYRLHAVAPGHVIARRTIELFQDESGFTLALEQRDESARLPATEHDWTSRRDLPIELRYADLAGDELVEWLEVIAGVRVERDEAVVARLRSSTFSPAFGQTPLRRALKFVAFAGRLEFDAERGTLSAKTR